MWRDVQYGFRQMRRNRFFCAVVIALLAAGIGANTLVFSLVNELLLKPLPVRNPDNLYLLEQIEEHLVRPQTSFGYIEFRDLLARHPAFSAAVAEQEQTQSEMVPLSSAAPVRLVMAQMVSPNYFSELGVRAIVGRVLNEADASGFGAIPAVLSYQFWQSQFGGNCDIIGRTIRLKGHPFEVAGVLPREFHSSDADRAPDVRLPISAATALTGHEAGYIGGPYPQFRILVRLAPGITLERAAEAIHPRMRSLEEWVMREANVHSREPLPAGQLQRQIDSLNFHLVFVPAASGTSQLRDQFSRALWLLLGGVGVLLLAVCANVAGLLLAKADERRREIGIRIAIGAGRWQLVRQLLTESLLLALPGALLGALLAYAVSPSIVGLLPPPRDPAHLTRPQLLTVTPDLRVLLFTIGVTAFCVLAFGLLPARRGTRQAAGEWKATARRGHRGMAAVAPIALQVSFCVLLLSAATLMLRTFWNLEHLDTGLDRAHIAEFTIDLGPSGYTPGHGRSFYSELKRRVEALPGVRSTAYARLGVMRGTGMKTTVAPQGVVIPRETFLNTSVNAVTPGYFRTMGMSLLAGRALEPGDVGRKPAPIMVNRAFADFFFPHQDPLGKAIVQGWDGNQKPASVIVGVTTTAKYRSMREPDPPTFYGVLREDIDAAPQLVLYVRAHGSPSAILNAVRGVLAGLDPTVPVLEVHTLEQEIQTSLWQERLVALLSAFFGAVAAVLASIGLYGALTYSVAQRTHELGIRVAVGARARHILWTVCSPLAAAVACGLAGGLLAAIFLLRVTERLLFGVRPLDPISLAAASAFAILCAVAAAVRPAWRAAAIDPSIALREE